MADKAINELVAATNVTPTDLFVLQQSGTAKKLSGQILENWLVSFANGHGGIQSIVKRSTSGLKDTYRITLADTTTFDFVVTNGRSITGVSKVSTSGLVDTHRISYNDGTNSTFSVTNGRGIENFGKVSSVGLVDTYQITYNDGSSTTFTVKNGQKGDPGDTPQVWVRYSSQEPTEASHDFGVLPDSWMGFCSNYESSAPTDWQAYTWFKIKGEKGDIGDPATVMSYSVEYLASDSGTIVPSGSWTQSVPAISQGRYLWTRITIQFNTGNPIVSYSVSRMGMDGTGSVSMVNQISPDSNGNVQLTAAQVGALPVSGGTMTGGINMAGQSLTGLSAPAADTDAVNKGYAAGLRVRNLLDNSDFTNPVNQRGETSYRGVGYAIDRWRLANSASAASLSAGTGIVLPATGSQNLINQRFPLGTFAGKEMTFAVCLDGGDIIVGNMVFPTSGNVTISGSGGDNVFLSLDARNGYDEVRIGQAAAATVGNTVVWAALYEGSYTLETLPPYVPKGYGVELVECQRYFHVYASSGARPAKGLDCAPSMRINNVTQGTLSVNGATYYYNSADL